MNYGALLFCPDDKTARVVAQVLSELDFAVEACAEPFPAVKLLMAKRFDAVVVDCADEQNAALLFKSVRNSGSNQSALMVAVVGDQAGVAKAFRLGANLVLTKPINVEQAKGTLRVARGLLKKSEADKASGSNQTAPQAETKPQVSNPGSARPNPPAFTPPAVASAPRAPISVPKPLPINVPSIAASALELEPETTPQTSADDAALLESLPEPVNPYVKSAPAASIKAEKPSWPGESHSSSASSSSGATATAPAKIKEIASIESKPVERPPAAAVFAPANRVENLPEVESIESPTSHYVEAPLFSAVSGTAEARESGEGNNKIVIAAVVAVVVLGLGFFGWSKMHSRGSAPTSTPTVARVAISQPEVTMPKPDATVTAAPLSRTETTPPASASTPLTAKTSSASTSAAPSNSKTQPSSKVPANNASEEPAVEPLMVKSEGPKPPAPVNTDSTATPEPPPVEMSSGNSTAAMSGIVGSVTASVPKHSAQTVKVSQGVSQGLLINKVPPTYPRQAMQARIQGAVELLANISKDGSVGSVKVLSGDAQLAGAAVDAVKQWKYKPYYLDGEAIDIQTQITVNFKLP